MNTCPWIIPADHDPILRVRPRRNTTRIFALGLAATIIIAVLSQRTANAANRFWDTIPGAGNGVGGSATWTNQTDNLWSTTASGDAALTSAATTDAGIFQGTAGTITLAGSFTLASWAFNVSGYKITASDETTRTLTGTFSLANNVTLTIGNGETSTRIIALAGSLSGGTGSGLTINATATGSSLTGLNLASSGMTISVPITFTGTGFGAISATNNGTISGTVTGNGSPLTLGADSGATLTLSNTINNGSGAVRLTAGPSGGGATVTISSTGNTWGDTDLNNSSTYGTLRLGATDALPTGTTLVFGATVGTAEWTFDLGGFNQTIGQLRNGAQSGGAIQNSVDNTTSKLTISGSETFGNFSGVIADGGTSGKISLERAGTGKTILGNDNTYTGSTTTSGGTLQIDNGNNPGRISGTSGVTVNSGGTLLLSGNSGITDRINDSATMTLAGGTFETGGMSERGGTVSAPTAGMGALTLNATSTINFAVGTTTSIIEFAGVGPHVGGTVLQIINWDGSLGGGGSERLLFAGTTTNFTSVYNQNEVSFDGMLGYAAIQFSGFFEVTPVPEPSTWIVGALAMGAVAFAQRRSSWCNRAAVCPKKVY